MTRFTSMLFVLCLSAVAAFAQTKVTTDDIIKMSKAGLSEDVILPMVEQSDIDAPSVDQVLKLNEAGVSENIIKALINGGKTAPTAQPKMTTATTPIQTIEPEEVQPEEEKNTGIVGTTVGSVTSGTKKVGRFLTSPFGGGNKNNDEDDNIAPVNGLRIYITAKKEVVNGMEFPDKRLEDSAHDLKVEARKMGFVVSDDENSADLMLMILERENKEGRPNWWKHKTKNMEAVLSAALLQKENGAWKPAIKLNNGAKNWTTSAWLMMREVNKFLNGKLLKDQ